MAIAGDRRSDKKLPTTSLSFPAARKSLNIGLEPAMTVAISREDLALALAPSLGEEKSVEVVLAALAKLGFDAAVLEPVQVDAVLDLLAKESGLVGVAARVAKQRSRVFSDDPAGASSGDSSATRRSLWPRTDARLYESSSTLRAPSVPPRQPDIVRVKDIVRMLGAAVGDVRSEEAVASVLARLEIRGTADSPVKELSREQALEVLELLATEPGKLGVTARFAKARLLLKA